MGAALRRCWRQRRRSVAGYTLTIFIQILPQSSFNLMGIWIFHRCNSKRGSLFLYLNESSALCDGKVYALWCIYIPRAEKIPYSIFPACFSSRAARARVYAARQQQTEATFFSFNLPNGNVRNTPRQPASQPTNQPARHTVQMYGENSSS